VTDAAVMATAKALRQAYDSALVERLAINHNEALVLARLATDGPLTQVELARHVGLSRARVGVHIDSLVAKDAVRREADPSDRRVWRVSLTRSGRRLWKRSVDITRTVRATAHQGLADSDLDGLTRHLQTIQTNLAAIAGSGT
jgi:MarR family transcriptional regulator, transcriptional regulator for hemolysin